MGDRAMKVEPKHEYREPKLIVYGDLSQITNAHPPPGPKNDHIGGNKKSG